MSMQLKNVKLRRIEKSDLELLRTWRNAKKIAANMFFQKYISKKMQTEWYDGLSKESDFYFLILYKEKEIGLINLSNIDYVKKEGHVGLFIYNESYWGGPAAIYASLILLHFAFKEKDLSKVWAHVRNDNQKAKKYNENLGFETKNKEWQYLTKENYGKTSYSLYLKFFK